MISLCSSSFCSMEICFISVMVDGSGEGCPGSDRICGADVSVRSSGAVTIVSNWVGMGVGFAETGVCGLKVSKSGNAPLQLIRRERQLLVLCIKKLRKPENISIRDAHIFKSILFQKYKVYVAMKFNTHGLGSQVHDCDQIHAPQPRRKHVVSPMDFNCNRDSPAFHKVGIAATKLLNLFPNAKHNPKLGLFSISFLPSTASVAFHL
ncbi:hypothetical protein Tco_0384965 [Tanacetum coccineum]